MPTSAVAIAGLCDHRSTIASAAALCQGSGGAAIQGRASEGLGMRVGVGDAPGTSAGAGVKVGVGNAPGTSAGAGVKVGVGNAPGTSVGVDGTLEGVGDGAGGTPAHPKTQAASTMTSVSHRWNAALAVGFVIAAHSLAALSV